VPQATFFAAQAQFWRHGPAVAPLHPLQHRYDFGQFFEGAGWHPFAGVDARDDAAEVAETKHKVPVVLVATFEAQYYLSVGIGDFRTDGYVGVVS